MSPTAAGRLRTAILTDPDAALERLDDLLGLLLPHTAAEESGAVRRTARRGRSRRCRPAAVIALPIPAWDRITPQESVPLAQG